MAPSSNRTDVLMKRGSLGIDIYTGRVLSKDKGRDWSNVAEAKASQGLPAYHGEQGERHGADSSLMALRRSQSY